MTSSNGNIFRVTGPLCGEFTGPGEFPTQRPVTRSFDVFFDLRLNKRLNKQSWGWWFETLSRPFGRHRNELPLQVVWLNWLPIQRQSPKAQWNTLYEVWLPLPRQNHPLQTGKLENWEVFLYTWWPPKISFHEIVNLWMVGPALVPTGFLPKRSTTIVLLCRELSLYIPGPFRPTFWLFLFLLLSRRDMKLVEWVPDFELKLNTP